MEAIDIPPFFREQKCIITSCTTRYNKDSVSPLSIYYNPIMIRYNKDSVSQHHRKKTTKQYLIPTPVILYNSTRINMLLSFPCQGFKYGETYGTIR